MRWGVALGLLVACQANKTAPLEAGVVVAAAVSVAKDLPPAVGKLASATTVEIHDTKDSDSERGDIVVRLARVSDHFDWDGKGVPFASALGERIPDPLDPKKCTCDVLDHCPTCDDVPASAVQRKSGRLPASVVDTFLAAIAQHGYSGADGGAFVVQPSSDRAHIVVTVPGEPPLHVGYADPAHQWSINDKPVDDAASLHEAYKVLRTALDLSAWMTAMTPAAAPTLPADFADMPKAAAVEVHDLWNGLGTTHDEVIHLERTKSGFDWRAKIASSAGSLGDFAPDPTDPPQKYSTPCRCDIASTCPCEHAFQLLRKSGSTSAKAVEAFLTEIAKHTIDPSPPKIGSRWTDDYPKGHVIVWVTSSSTPIHLSFLDQQRQWRANGRILSPDPGPTGLTHGQHAVINASYRAMLDSLGDRKWIDEVHKLKSTPIRHR